MGEVPAHLLADIPKGADEVLNGRTVDRICDDIHTMGDTSVANDTSLKVWVPATLKRMDELEKRAARSVAFRAL